MKYFNERDFDEWWLDETFLAIKEIDGITRIRIIAVTHRNNENDEPFWRGIKIQKVVKNEKGRWVYKGKFYLPLAVFGNFCDLLGSCRVAYEKVLKDAEQEDKEIEESKSVT